MEINTQPPEVVKRTDGVIIDLHSVFRTIQGEGPHAGRAALFVRLAGCNLQCPLCDTEYTEGRTEHRSLVLAEQIATAFGPQSDVPTGLVVITGGEPFRQNIGRFVAQLVRMGFHVQVETNGRLAPQGIELLEQCRELGMLDVVISPKTPNVHPDCVKLASAFKYVLQAGDVAEDGLPRTALGHPLGGAAHIARPPSWWQGPVYVQPADEQDDAANQLNLNAATSAVLMAHPSQDRRLGVQMHKYAGLE